MFGAGGITVFVVGAMVAASCVLLLACLALKLDEWGIHPLRTVAGLAKRSWFERLLLLFKEDEMMRGYVCLLLMVALSISSKVAQAGCVDWNTYWIESAENPDEYYLSWYAKVGSSPRPLTMYSKLVLAYGEGDSRYLCGEKRGTGLGDTFIGNMLLAVAGDIVDSSTARFQGDYFLHDKLDNEPYSDSPFEVKFGSEYYFAIVAGDFDEYRKGGPYKNVNYGWVKIGVGEEGELSVLGSAMGVDGQAMIVGGGDVPEPTSALLLLVGSAALLLRRRRRL